MCYPTHAHQKLDHRTTTSITASLCSKVGNSDSVDVDSPINQAFRDRCFTIPWLEALHGLSWRLVPKPALSKPQAKCHYRLSGGNFRSWPTLTTTVSASPALDHGRLRVARVALRHHSPEPTPRLFVGRSNTAQSEDIQIVAHRFPQCKRRGCALERTTVLR